MSFRAIKDRLDLYDWVLPLIVLVLGAGCGELGK